MDQHNWRLRLSKCRWCQQSLEYVGYKLTRRGWEPTDSMLHKLDELERLVTVAGWRALKGWLLQCVRFMFQGLKVWQAFLQASCSGTIVDWKVFVNLLSSHMVHLAHASQGDRPQ